MKWQIIKPAFLVLGGCALAALLSASPSIAQSSDAPAASGDAATAEDGRQTRGQGQGSRSGNTETLIQEAPRPGIPGGEERLKRLKRAPGGKSEGGTVVPPER